MLIMPLFLCLLALAIVLGMTGLPVLISLKAECIEGKEKCWFVTDYKKAGQPDRVGMNTERNLAQGCSTKAPVVQRLLPSLPS